MRQSLFRTDNPQLMNLAYPWLGLFIPFCRETKSRYPITANLKAETLALTLLSNDSDLTD